MTPFEPLDGGTAPATLRERLYRTLEAGRADDLYGRLTDVALVALIVLNAVAVILESVPSIRRGNEAAFAAFETFSVIVFTLEYALRVWTSVEMPAERYSHPVWGRLRYMVTPLALLDLAVILPFYLAFVVGVDLRILRVVRLFRVFRLTRYSAAMNLLLQVLREEGGNISAALFVILMMMLFAASVTFLAEHQAQPEAFGSIPQALWWAVITMTTIGYGDVIPVTVVGRICGAFIAVLSLGMIALPAGIIASGFNEALHRRRRRFADQVATSIADHKMSEAEREELRALQNELGLSDAEAASIFNAVRRQATDAAEQVCPHCGRPIAAVDKVHDAPKGSR